ncbi:MAG: DUF4830 domain-containing protein [Oscillospiraceae bacterium]|nr:DUF4830 domain-containing protein [Oscillospiraceae bacterium]
MMIMTAKVDFKKIILIAAGAAVLILAAIFLLGGTEGDPVPAPTVLEAGSNDGRIQFLKDLGWDVSTSPTESGQVKIPADSSEVFDRYNLLQKGQGYDLSTYAGKTVMRYVYKINNYPGASAPVYATVLVHNDRVIGGDVTDTAPGGRIHSLKMPAAVPSPSLTGPSESQP